MAALLSSTAVRRHIAATGAATRGGRGSGRRAEALTALGHISPTFSAEQLGSWAATAVPLS